MNTYGDNGNVLMLKYVAEKARCAEFKWILSLEDGFGQGQLRHRLWWC